jgi:hypothetical protein
MLTLKGSLYFLLLVFLYLGHFKIVIEGIQVVGISFFFIKIPPGFRDIEKYNKSLHYKCPVFLIISWTFIAPYIQ